MAVTLAAAMAAALAMTGCGSGSQGTAASAGTQTGAESTAGKESGASSSGEEQELTVWGWDVALMQLKEAAEAYQKDHPNVKFKFEEMGTDQIYKKLSTSLATGNGIADIIQIEGEVLPGYADKFPEGFLDVADSVSKDDFLQAKLAEVTYKNKVHAFPWDAGPEALFYRTDYFEQAGVKAEDLKTWDDFIEAGKKVEAVCKTPKGDPVKMLPINPQKGTFYSLLRGQYGLGVFDQDGKPIVNDEKSIAAMKEANKVYQSGIALNINGWDEYEQTVVNESVACIPEAVWMIGTIKDKGPQTAGKWGVVDLPMIDGGEYSCSNGGSDLAINAKTKYPDAAKDFCKFAMTDTKLQASGFEKYGLYPSYIPSYTEDVFQKGDSFFGTENIYKIFIDNSKKVAGIPVCPNTQEASDAIGAAVSKIFLNGEDVDTTMQNLQQDLQTKFG